MISRMLQRIHPTTRLLLWLMLVLAVQAMSFTSLAFVALMISFLGPGILGRGKKLVWRTRWLLLSMFAIFAWGVAGEPLWDMALAPTREGVDEALKHLFRLVIILMVVAAILETMPLNELMVATHTLLKPLHGVGLNPDRGVVRLMLVLRYVETLPTPRDWKTLLSGPEAILEEEMEIRLQTFRYFDGLLLLAGFSGLISLYFL